MSTGEQVGQLSVQYDFTPSTERKHGPAFAIYFETVDGGIHQVSKDTQCRLHEKVQERV